VEAEERFRALEEQIPAITYLDAIDGPQKTSLVPDRSWKGCLARASGVVVTIATGRLTSRTHPRTGTRPPARKKAA
jgi:hypothetical protein